MASSASNPLGISSTFNSIPRPPNPEELQEWLWSLLQQHTTASKVTSPHSRAHRQDFEKSANLSSQLTLQFYFAQAKRSLRGSSLRFDEISPSSDRATLLRYAKEHNISINDEDSNTSSAVYQQILASMAAPAPGPLPGIDANRVKPDCAYGKLNPMPKAVHTDGSEDRMLTDEVLEAYGVHKDEHMHFSLSEVLKSMGVVHTTDFTISNGRIHFDIILTGHQKRGQSFKVALLVHDRECFNDGTNKVNAHVGMKKKSLKAMGFSVVTVPFFEWENLKTRGQQVAYIAGKLSRAGFWGEGGGVFGESGTVVKQILRSVRR